MFFVSAKKKNLIVRHHYHRKTLSGKKKQIFFFRINPDGAVYGFEIEKKKFLIMSFLNITTK